MAAPVIKPGTVPNGTQLPDTVQKLINLLAGYLVIDGLGSLQGVVIDDAEPAAADRDKAWVKLDAGSGRAIGIFYYSGGWNQIPVVMHSGEDAPANPKQGELFYNTTLETIEVYGEGWTNELWARGASADRPEEPAIGYLYFDTTITRLLRYTSQGWSTVEGAIGEIRMFADISVADAETRNPGWTVYAEMAGRFPIGQGTDYEPGTSGGRESFEVSGTIAKNDSLGGEGSVNKLTIDGESLGGPEARDNYASLTKSLTKDVSIIPPYKAVIYMRKQF